MPCYHPVRIKVWRKAFKPGGIRVMDRQVVPCGSCLWCRSEQARQWSVRLMHELQMHESAWFLTLTYEDGRIPENGSLCPKDFQRFVKAVRRDHEAQTIRYYGCGEYGERTKRPHYHAVLYGAEFLDKRFLRSGANNDIWRSESLETYWPHGLSEFGTVTTASASYVAGYVRKKVSKKVNPEAYTRLDPDTGELVELEPEFSRMSLRPAIGLKWIEKYWTDVYPRDFVVMDGVEMKPPRYYDKWMEREHPEVFFEVLQNRHEEADSKEDMRQGRLEAKEKIHASRVNLFQRRITV